MKLTRVALTLLLCLTVGCRPARRVQTEEHFKEIGPVVEEEIDKGNFPGAVVLVGK